MHVHVPRIASVFGSAIPTRNESHTPWFLLSTSSSNVLKKTSAALWRCRKINLRECCKDNRICPHAGKCIKFQCTCVADDGAAHRRGCRALSHSTYLNLGVWGLSIIIMHDFMTRKLLRKRYRTMDTYRYYVDKSPPRIIIDLHIPLHDCYIATRWFIYSCIIWDDGIVRAL